MLLQATSPVRLAGTLSRALAQLAGHRRRLAGRRRPAGAVHLGQGAARCRAHRRVRRHRPPPPPGPHPGDPALPRDRLALRHPHLGLRRARQPARRPDRAVRHGRGRGHRRRHRARPRGRRPHEAPPTTALRREPRMIIERTSGPSSSTARTRCYARWRRSPPTRRASSSASTSTATSSASISDGDFRRWIAAQADVDLTRPCAEVANTAARSAPATATPAEIRRLFVGAIDHVAAGRRARPPRRRRDQPHRRLPGRPPRRRPRPPGLPHRRDRHQPPRVGRPGQAARRPRQGRRRRLREVPAARHGRALPQAAPAARARTSARSTPSTCSRGSTSPAEQLFEVFDHCRDVDIDIMCTPWDAPSVDALVDYGIPALKIASADLTNHALLTHAAASGTPLVISTGMSTEAEIRESVAVLRASGTPYALLHCQSTYPAPFKDVNLRYLTRLAELGDCPVGYSGHERGFHVPVAAVALGATHHREALHRRPRHGGQRPQGLAAARRVRRDGGAHPRGRGGAGHRRAARGVDRRDDEPGQPRQEPGRRPRPRAAARSSTAPPSTSRAPAAACSPTPSTGSSAAPPTARCAPATSSTPPTCRMPCRRVATSPSAARGACRCATTTSRRSPRTAPPTSSSSTSPTRTSRSTPRRCCPTGCRWATPATRPTCSPATSSSTSPARTTPTGSARSPSCSGSSTSPARCGRSSPPTSTPSSSPASAGSPPTGTCRSTSCPTCTPGSPPASTGSTTAGVRLSCQTLPPFPWYMGGQLYCNLFVRASDTAEFAARYDRRLCLDVSHTKLAATYLGQPFSEAVELLAPHSRPPAPRRLRRRRRRGRAGRRRRDRLGRCWPASSTRSRPGSGFIPEIWQGHVNDGEGFWLALERLEQWF